MSAQWKNQAVTVGLFLTVLFVATSRGEDAPNYSAGDADAFMQDWVVLGPLESQSAKGKNEFRKALAEDYLAESGGESATKPKPGDKVRIGDKALVWRVVRSKTPVVELDKVLLVSDGEGVKIGQPYLDGAKVLATVQTELKGEKITVYKFKRRKTYQRKQGHRQKYLRVTIDKIQA